jgi:hypothetical protein
MNEFLNFVTYFSEGIVRNEPLLFLGRFLGATTDVGIGSERQHRHVPAMPDRNGSRCSHAASGRPHYATQYICLLHVQTHAHLHAAGHVYARDARGHSRTKGILGDRSAHPERTQAGYARIHPSSRGHQVRRGRPRALMYRGGSDHHGRWSSRSKHLRTATGLPADNRRRGRI